MSSSRRGGLHTETGRLPVALAAPIILVLLVVVSGCISQANTDKSPALNKSQTTSSPTPLDATSTSIEPSATETDWEPYPGHGSKPYEFWINLYTNTSKTIDIVIISADSNETVYENRFTLVPNESIKVDVEYPSAGQYVIRADVENGDSVEINYLAAQRNPDNAVVFSIFEDGTIKAARYL